jgi:hypothetical protein
MGPAVRYHEILRRLAIVDEEFVGDQAGLGLGTPADCALDAKTAALVRVGHWRRSGHRRSAWNGALPGRWRPARPKMRSPARCWPSPRISGSAGSPGPYLAWQSRSSMTSTLHWMSQMIADGSAEDLWHRLRWLVFDVNDFDETLPGPVE